VRSAGQNMRRNVPIGQNRRSGSALWMGSALVGSVQEIGGVTKSRHQQNTRIHNLRTLFPRPHSRA
jgi:hypothetical protein